MPKPREMSFLSRPYDPYATGCVHKFADPGETIFFPTSKGNIVIRNIENPEFYKVTPNSPGVFDITHYPDFFPEPGQVFYNDGLTIITRQH